MRRELTCDEYCQYAQHCTKYDLWTTKNTPEKCMEFVRLEDYAWDAECDYLPEEFEDWDNDEEPIPFDDPPEAWEEEEDG